MRRAWIEMDGSHPAIVVDGNVALHAEGVDRNLAHTCARESIVQVALHAEGVDRNKFWP